MSIDWQRVCLNIRNSGMSLASAAQEIRCDYQHLQRMARGEVEQPRFNTGLKLLDLHLDKCPEKHKALL